MIDWTNLPEDKKLQAPETHGIKKGTGIRTIETAQEEKERTGHTTPDFDSWGKNSPIQA